MKSLPLFEARMRAAGLPSIAIEAFAQAYRRLVAGETGMIDEASIAPVEDLPDLDRLPAGLADVGRSALGQAVVIRLNGGLGTSMGLEKAKSLLPVRDGLTFLDVIVRQASHLGARLLLMNSFATEDDTRVALRRYPDLPEDIPLTFVQNRVPKVHQDDLSPARWPRDSDLEWCPPGHGDIYTALQTTGILEKLLEAGCRWAFIANADNLGAVLDARLLGWFIENRLPFAMEVADRTDADRKGGHLARRGNRLILRELAQCSADEHAHFQDIRRHRYFNTNNLWIDLQALREVLRARSGVLGLPIIVNKKTVDPRDPDSPAVFQLESAMGAAIGVMEGAGAIRVPRGRFSPVKTTDDLLVVRSDAYRLTDDWRVVLDAPQTPLVALDPKYYKMVDDLEARFPHGPPSLRACTSLRVEGDVRFGRGVVVRGAVVARGVSEIPDGAVLEAVVTSPG
ncbi:MAG: UTP--glucose-1-phosphate uridylyltransferase [Armatimonadetes bacterium]|nr:UTP--glucose-1-phosphate uridylyltransferase [Armatimonadota bacterium]